jgi:tetratricopeptide (TPR) repeat protein
MDPAQELLLARMQVRVRDYGGALETTRLLTEHSPDCLLAWRIRAACAMHLGERAVAEEAFRSCIDIDPEDALAHVGLACCAEATGDLAAAIGELRRARELAPADGGIVDELARLGDAEGRSPVLDARLALAEGDPGKALRILDHEPLGDAAALLTLTRALYVNGRIHEAWTLAGRVAREHPRCLAALEWLRVCAMSAEGALTVRMLTRRIDAIDPGMKLYHDRMGAFEPVSGADGGAQGQAVLT